MLRLIGAWAAVLSLCLAVPQRVRGAGNTLAIIAAGVEASEDAPFVPKNYHFLPGDYVYFTFEITGFSVSENAEDDVRSISLAYEVTPEDASGRPLTPSERGTIQTTLAPEDKNWTPKRRASFLLPPFLAAGEYHIHVVVKDAVGKAQVARDYPFEIGGVTIQPATSITVENFRFLRQADDTTPLEVPAYSPGDHVFARFELVGYKLGPGNAYHVAYDITVTSPDGKTFIQQPNAAELHESSFYPAQFVPGSLNLSIPKNSVRGEYIIELRARDLIGNQTYELKKAFSIE